jgi:hypothetical protein
LTPRHSIIPVFRAGVLQIAGILVGDTVDLDEFVPVGMGLLRIEKLGRADLSHEGSREGP